MAAFDTTELLEDIRVRGSLPSADARFTDAKLLAIATRELRNRVFPLVVNARAELGVYDSSQAIVPGQRAYRMPTGAAAGRLRDVVHVDAAGCETSLREVSPDDAPDWGAGEGRPEAYFLRNYSVHLLPTPSAAGTLRTPYYARPSALVLPSATTLVVSFGDTSVTPDVSPPAAIITGGARLQFVRGTPGFETLGEAVVVSFTGSLNLDRAPPSDLAAGDYVCLTGQAPVPQVPDVLLGLLAVRAARVALKSIGEDGAADSLAEDEAAEMASASIALTPRVDGEPRIIPFVGVW